MINRVNYIREVKIMAEHYIDTEKFYIRAIQEADMEQVTAVINNTKFSKLFKNSGDIELQDT